MNKPYSVKSCIRQSWLILSLFVISFNAFAQEMIVKGIVTDKATGDPLPGLNITIQGTSSGTTTNLDGTYQLEVPDAENTVLIFSYVGYQEKKVPVNNRSTIDVVLAEEAYELADIVVTALGVEKEVKSVGYSVQKVEGKSLTQSRETNLVNSLTGKVAGVNITGSSSGPTASANINIRGQSSLTGNNQPLFVVNGLPITNGLNSPGDGLNGSTTIDFGNAASLVNPDDIETISVLKGPAAAALYGTRASNGVILITTKTGRGADGWQVSLNSNLTMENVLKFPDYQDQFGGGGYGRRDYVNGTQYFGSYDAFGESWGPPTDGRLVRQFGSDGEPIPFTPAPDNIKNFYRTGRTFTNNVSLNYAQDDSDFRLSYTNLNQQGIVPNTDLNRNNFYGSMGTKLNNLTVRANAMIIDGESGNVPNAGYDESSSIMYGWLWYPRHLPLNRIENYWEEEDVRQRNHESLWTNNPYFLVNENTNSYQRRRYFGNLKLRYDIGDNFYVRYRFSGDVNNESRQYRRAISTRGTPGERGSYREDELFFREVNNELTINYKLGEVQDDFVYNFTLGVNRMRQEGAETRNYAPGLTIPGLFNLGNAFGNISTSQADQNRQINSVFGLASIAYQNMIFLDITGRNDWSSTLPADNNSYFYPSVALSAVFTDLFDISVSSPLSFGKIRLAYAEVGGDTNPYNLVNVFNFQDLWEGQPVTTKSTFLRNPDLRPETTSSYEIGTDLRFFRDRLQLDATYYFISSKDQIINLPLAESSGYTSRLINAGEIQNRGIEIFLGARPIENELGFNWDIGFNFSSNRSEVVSLAPGINNYQIVADMYPNDGGQDLSLEARVGEPYGQLVGLDLQRVQEGPYKGQIINENGLPLVGNEKVSAGTFQPDFLAGIINTFTYKNFTLSFQFDGRVGGKIYSRTHTMLASGGAITNEDDETLGSILVGRQEYAPLEYDANGNPPLDDDGNYIWGEVVNPGSFVGPGVKADGNGGWVPNDEEVATRDYVYRYYNNIFNRDIITTGTYENTWMKLRELRLTYRLPQTLVTSIGLTNATISVVGRNLLLFSDVPSIDPEAFSIRNGRIVQGFESTQLPSTRSFGFNINVTL